MIAWLIGALEIYGRLVGCLEGHCVLPDDRGGTL